MGPGLLAAWLLLACVLLTTVAERPAAGLAPRGTGPAAEARGATLPVPDRLVWAGQRGIVAPAGWAEGRQRFAPLVDPSWPGATSLTIGSTRATALAIALAVPYLLPRGPNAVRAPPAG